MNEEAQEKKLIKNTGILAIGTVLTKCVSFFIVIFYSSWLTEKEYGQFELFVSYVSLLIPLFSLSCGEAIFRLMLEKHDYKEEKELISSGFVVYVLGFLISSIAVFGLFSNTFGNIIFYFIILYFAEMIYNFCTFVARGVRKLTCYAISGVVNTLVMAFLTVTLVRFLNFGLIGLIIGYCCGYICASFVICMVINIPHYLSLKYFSDIKLHEMLQYSIPLIPNSIAWWIASASDRTIVAINLGTDYTGIYSIAQKIPSLCVIIYNVFHLSWQENASDAFMSGAKQQEYYSRIFNRIFPTLLSVSMFVLSINYYMYKYIFDPKYVSGYTHVCILVTSTIFSFLSQFIGGIFIAQKKPKSNGITTMIAAITNIIVDLILINYIGLYAASVSTVVAYVTLFVIRIILIRESFRVVLTKTNLLFIVLYAYFVSMQFINLEWTRIINLVIAVVVVLFSNIDLIKIFIKTLISRIVKKQ